MANLLRPDFGTVVLVPFPFTDQSGSKKRPAVIVSGSAYNAQRRDVVIVAITSQLRSSTGFGEALVMDWKSAGLIKPSAFKPVFATIEQALILRTMGVLGVADRVALRGIIAAVF